MLQIVHITVAWSLSSVMGIQRGPKQRWGDWVGWGVWSMNLPDRSNRVRFLTFSQARISKPWKYKPRGVCKRVKHLKNRDHDSRDEEEKKICLKHH